MESLGKALIVLGQLLLGLAWIVTVLAVAQQLGLGWAAATLFFPPLDLIMVFIVDTWQLHLPGLAALLIGVALTAMSSTKASNIA